MENNLILKRITKLLWLRTHAGHDLGDLARLLLHRCAAHNQIGKALGDFRGEVRNIDGFTYLKGSPQPLFKEIVDVVVKGGHQCVLTLPFHQDGGRQLKPLPTCGSLTLFLLCSH
jgi:hypothetical protein